MTAPPTLRTLASWLAGTFDNREQAIAEPAWFVHLQLWHRPLPQRLAGCIALFAEQANVLQREQPYRQRLLLLQETEPWQVQYLALRHPAQFRGAGAHPDRLAALTLDDVEWLPGCVLTVAWHDDRFVARMPPHTRCCFQYGGETRQVVLGFAVRAEEFWSDDRGIDPETGRSLWGALHGAYAFRKREAWSGQLPS